MGILTDLVDRSVRLSDLSKRNYKVSAASFEAFAGGAPASWTALTVEAWRDRLAADGARRTTVNKHLSRVQTLSRRFHTLGLGPDFARGAERFAGADAQARQALTRTEIADLLAACGGGLVGERDRFYVVFSLRTCARVGAAVGLMWRDVDLASAAGAAVRLYAKNTDGKSTYRIRLDGEAIEAIERWRASLVAAGAEAGSGPVLRSLRRAAVTDTIDLRQPWSERAAHRTLTDLGRKAGIRRTLHPHLLRHTAISQMLEAGMSPAEVMLVSGHRSLATLSRYVSSVNEGEAPSNRMPRFDR